MLYVPHLRQKCPQEREARLKIMASNTGLWKGKVLSHDCLLRKCVSCHTNSPQPSTPLSVSSSLTSVGKAGATGAVVWVGNKHSVKVTVSSPSAPALYSEESRAEGKGATCITTWDRTRAFPAIPWAHAPDLGFWLQGVCSSWGLRSVERSHIQD